MMYLTVDPLQSEKCHIARHSDFAEADSRRKHPCARLCTTHHARDAANRITAMNDAQYGCDATSQLVSAEYKTLPEELYEYDANGNRKAYETGKNNQLLSDGVFDYKYDDEGNRIAKQSKDSLTCYEWDHRNRLIRVIDNGKPVEYAYDYQNRLVRRGDELFVHDGWQIAMTLDSKGNIKDRNLWGANQDELIAVNDQFTLCDHLGSVRGVIDSRGKVIEHREYNAFGKVVKQTGKSVSVFGYTGKMLDDATGLQWNINRWYDAKVGRWVSEDPIGFEGNDMNLLRYVANSPIMFIDPDGKAKQVLIIFAPVIIITPGGGLILGALTLVGIIVGICQLFNTNQVNVVVEVELPSNCGCDPEMDEPQIREVTKKCSRECVHDMGWWWPKNTYITYGVAVAKFKAFCDLDRRWKLLDPNGEVNMTKACTAAYCGLDFRQTTRIHF